MNTNTGLEFVRTKQSKLQEIKNSGLSKEIQIRDYMEYLYKNCDYRFPEFMLEWVAREHLGLDSSTIITLPVFLTEV